MLDPVANSLIFDFEAALPVDDGAKSGLIDVVHDANLVGQRLETLCRASCPFARELRCNLQRILLANCDKECEDVFSLARCLASLGYIVAVRFALPGTGADCFKSLRHEFLIVRGTGEFCGMEFIVEPSLRQHFAIPHPSPDYEYVLSRTPDVFVGGSCRLVPVIQLLCALMADSFQRKGLPLPPWRREAAMLSKWLPHPARTRDRPVLSSSIAAAASAIFIPAVDDGANPAAAAAATVAALRCDCFPATSNPAAAQEGFSDMLPSDLRVSLNDSSGASTDSSGGFAGCVPLDGSPVSVLRLPGAATGHGEEGGEAEAADRPPPMTALVEDLPAASNIRKFVPTVRHHPRDVVEPPAPVKGIGSAPAAAQLGPIGRAKSDSTDLVAAATSADGPPQPMAPTLAPAAFEHYHGAEETLPQTDARPTWSSAPERGPAGLPPDPDPRCSDEDSSGCSSGDDDSCTYEEGGESDSADRAGLLSLQMQKHQHQRQPLPRSTAAARELGRIRTHPPVHRGEMAIRVVKLVGFSASGSLERHRPPAPQLQPQLHQAVARAALTGAGSAVALGRDLRTSWKARQRAV